MQLNAALLALLLLGPAPAMACTIGIGTPGLLGLSADGRALGSANGLGAVILISDLNLLGGPSTITLSNTRLDSAPAGAPPPDSFSGTYTARWLLNSSSGPLAPSASFQVTPVLGLVVTIDLNVAAHSAAGFRQGSYSLKTSVTCS